MRGEVIGTLSVDAPYLDDAPLQATVRLLVMVAGMVAQDVASRRRTERERSDLLEENLRLQGQLRELQDCIEHAVLRSDDGVLHAHHLPPALQTAASSGTGPTGSLAAMMASYEREILVDALRNTRGNMAKAARILKTTPRIFAYRTRKLGVDPRSYRR